MHDDDYDYECMIFFCGGGELCCCGSRSFFVLKDQELAMIEWCSPHYVCGVQSRHSMYIHTSTHHTERSTCVCMVIYSVEQRRRRSLDDI